MPWGRLPPRGSTKLALVEGYPMLDPLDTEAATTAKLAKQPYSLQPAGRAALDLWIKPLAEYLATLTPPRGLEQVIYEQLAFMALTAILDRIYRGWNHKGGRRHKRDQIEMLFRLELGRAARDELEFAGLLAAQAYVLAARNKHAALGKFRRLDWTNRECVLMGDYLWAALAQMPCFDEDTDGYPCLHAEHKEAMERFAEEHVFDRPLYRPKLTEPPAWAAWRVECPGDIGATFAQTKDPMTAERIEAAFNDGEIANDPLIGDTIVIPPSIEPHARAVSAIQSVPFKINADMLPLVQQFADDECGLDIRMARRLVNEPRFWNRVRCDRRGRLIQMCHFNYTRSDPVRSLFLFAHGKPIGSSVYWLEIACANAHCEKGTWLDRHQWFAKERAMIEAVAAHPELIWTRYINERGKPKAKEPFQFAAACMEFVAADRGGPDYVTHLPVFLDASSNGLQHLAMMWRDVKLAQEVNLNTGASVLHGPEIRDIYETAAFKVKELIEVNHDTPSRFWLTHADALRDLIKQPVMTLPYGVGDWGMLDQIVNGCKDKGIEAPWEAMERLREHIQTAIKEHLSGALKAMEYIKGIAKHCLDHGTYLQWITPSGFPVENRYRESRAPSVRMPFSGREHKIADGYTDKPKKRKINDSAAANFVHSYDAAHLARSVNEANARGITNIMTIHDCYGCLAPDVTEFALIRRKQLVDMYGSEAHKLVDLHCDQMRLEMAPSAAVPFSIIKHDEFLRPAGNMVNMPKMLRILKEKKYGLGSGGDS